jgi:hypothetical protein
MTIKMARGDAASDVDRPHSFTTSGSGIIMRTAIRTARWSCHPGSTSMGTGSRSRETRWRRLSRVFLGRGA